MEILKLLLLNLISEITVLYYMKKTIYSQNRWKEEIYINRLLLTGRQMIRLFLNLYCIGKALYPSGLWRVLFYSAVICLWLPGMSVIFWKQMRDHRAFEQFLASLQQMLKKEQRNEILMIIEKTGSMFNSENVRYISKDASPATGGIRKPYLLFPAVSVSESGSELISDIFSEKEIEMICRHEEMHVMQNHLRWYQFWLIFRCIYWYDPLMKKLEERIHFLCDLEVDQLLICDMTHDERTEYASLLIRLSKGIGKENCLRIQYVLTWEKDFFDMRKGRTRRLLLFVVLLGIGIIGH